MLNEIAIIANKHADSITLATDAKGTLYKGEFTFTEFQSKVIEMVKNVYIDMVIFDATSVPETEVLNAVRDLKLHLNKNVRIIVVYPNLDDKVIRQQLYVYGIYDIVAPKLDEETMDELAMANLLVNEIKWAITEPVEFSKIADDLSVELITQTITNIVESNPDTKKEKETKKENSSISVLKKPRILCFYKDNAENFEKIESDKKYMVVNVLEATEELIAKQDYSSIDVIILDNVNVDYISYLQSLVEVNQNPATIVVGYDNFDLHAEASRIRNVRAFLYDGTEAQFRKNALRSITEKHSVKPATIAKIFSVMGVKGGVGATTLTAILAQDYAKKHPSERVCVVDYNTKAGDLGAMFGIAKPENNLYQYVQTMLKAKKEHLDMDLLKDKINSFCTYDKKRKLFVLPTTYTDIFKYLDNKESANDIAVIYEYTLECLKKNFDAIFVDVSKYAGFTQQLALSYADKTIYVTDAKLPSTYHMLGKFSENQNNPYFSLKDTTIIVNKADVKHNENEYENVKILEDKCGKDLLIVLPFDKKLALEEREMEIRYANKFKKAIQSVWGKVNREIAG